MPPTQSTHAAGAGCAAAAAPQPSAGSARARERRLSAAWEASAIMHAMFIISCRSIGRPDAGLAWCGLRSAICTISARRIHHLAMGVFDGDPARCAVASSVGESGGAADGRFQPIGSREHGVGVKNNESSMKITNIQ